MASLHVCALTEATNRLFSDKYTFYAIDEKSCIYEICILGVKLSASKLEKTISLIKKDIFVNICGGSLSREESTPYITLDEKASLFQTDKQFFVNEDKKEEFFHPPKSSLIEAETSPEKKRVHVSGILSKVSPTTSIPGTTPSRRRRDVVLTDPERPAKRLKLKLWGDTSELVNEQNEGMVATITNATVDVHEEKKELTSTEIIKIELKNQEVEVPKIETEEDIKQYPIGILPDDDESGNKDTTLPGNDPPQTACVSGSGNIIAQAASGASINIQHVQMSLVADIEAKDRTAIKEEIKNQVLLEIMSPKSTQEARPPDMSPPSASAAPDATPQQGIQGEMLALMKEQNDVLKRICHVLESSGCTLVKLKTNSIVFTLNISSRNRLRQFWTAYKEGKLQSQLHDILITKDLEEKVGCSLFLRLDMDEKEYLQGLEFFGKQELRLVLVGRSGVGKSDTGNHILLKYKKDQRPFETSACGTAVTRECSFSSNEVLGRNVVVVDTPGLFDTSQKNMDVLTQLTRCLLFTQPGPHAIILVMSVGRMTKEFQETVDLLVKLFKEGVYGYMIVLFTRKEDLEPEEKTFQEYQETLPPYMKKVVRMCGGRCMAFSNRASVKDNIAQVDALLRLVDGMVKENGGTCFESKLMRELGSLLTKREVRSDPETFRETVRNAEPTSGGWFWKAIAAIAAVFGWEI